MPLAAWLLLLLRDGESYGWALFERLRDRGINVHESLAYRTLRMLDAEGAIASSWEQSHAGPPRRSYRLSRSGRRRLAGLAANVTATWERHETFVRAYERAHAEQRGGDSSQIGVRDPLVDLAPRPDAASKPVVGGDLLAAWLLLLIELGPSYGYGLRRALDENQVRAEHGAVYRTLRALECDGYLKSSWTATIDGPRRRSYGLTADGRRHLDELAATIMATRDGLADFLRAYAEAPKKPRPHGRS